MYNKPCENCCVQNNISQSQINQTTKTIFKNHENEKKRQYLERVVQIENGSFTPLVFGSNGGMGEECEKFVSALADGLSAKSGESYAETIRWIRTQLSFEIIRAAVMCVRGSRVPFKFNELDISDFALVNSVTAI